MDDIYMWVCAGMLGAAALIWRYDDPFNFVIKLCLTGLSVWGIYLGCN